MKKVHTPTKMVVPHFRPLKKNVIAITIPITTGQGKSVRNTRHRHQDLQEKFVDRVEDVAGAPRRAGPRTWVARTHFLSNQPRPRVGGARTELAPPVPLRPYNGV